MNEFTIKKLKKALPESEWHRLESDVIDLSHADLSHADLSKANLSKANLSHAYLFDAYLFKTNLTKANLTKTNLFRAYLFRADLTNANLFNTIGNMKEIKSMQLEKYSIVHTHDRLQIGCENHSIADWFKFSDSEIFKMDEGALEWWKKWRDHIKLTIEMSPAVKSK